MTSALYDLLLWLPWMLAGTAGWLSGKSKSVILASLTGLLVSAYPIGHWHVLRLYREQFFDLNFKDEAVWSALTSYLVLVEIPTCLLIFGLSLWLCRRRIRARKSP